MNFKDVNLKIVLILSIIIVILLWKSCSNNANFKNQVNLYEAAQDSLHQTRNKLNQQVTKIAVFKASNKKNFLKLQSNDKTIIALQQLVKDYKGKLASATVLSTSTNDNGSTNTLIQWDTVKTDTGNYITPVYTSNWKEKWSEGNITATADSILRNIKIRNDFKMTIGKEKQGFFKKRKSVVTITNLNPNTITTELRTFNIASHKNKISFGVGVMYGFDIIGLKPTIVIGPTINIPLISL